MQEQNEKNKKLSEFDHALYLVNKIVRNKGRITKLNKEDEKVEKLNAEIAELEMQVDSILKNIFKGREELISVVKIDYNDIHVAETFQDYMQLI